MSKFSQVRPQQQRPARCCASRQGFSRCGVPERIRSPLRASADAIPPADRELAQVAQPLAPARSAGTPLRPRASRDPRSTERASPRLPVGEQNRRRPASGTKEQGAPEPPVEPEHQVERSRRAALRLGSGRAAADGAGRRPSQAPTAARRDRQNRSAARRASRDAEDEASIARWRDHRAEPEQRRTRPGALAPDADCGDCERRLQYEREQQRGRSGRRQHRDRVERAMHAEASQRERDQQQGRASFHHRSLRLQCAASREYARAAPAGGSGWRARCAPCSGPRPWDNRARCETIRWAGDET